MCFSSPFYYIIKTMSVGSLSEALRRLIGGFKDQQTRQNLVP